ncbi:MAG: flagellar biosynthesis anti-sigma factor FlgM [Sphingomonadaceae bacterium]|nr:flagellar biosynthesis anti-sigma factor FlgM [Sphingomonadaceae bacterium]
MVDSVTFGPAKPVPLGRASSGKNAEQAGRLTGAGTASAAQSLSLAAVLAQQGPPFDAEKVALLRAAIASGTYKVDLASIANGIIRFSGRNLG